MVAYKGTAKELMAKERMEREKIELEKAVGFSAVLKKIKNSVNISYYNIFSTYLVNMY